LGPQTSVTEIKRRTRAAFNYLLYNYYDLFRLPALDDKSVQQLVTIEGWNHVEAALAGGQGLIMVSTHLGNIEVVLYEMLRRGVAITIPVERVEPPQLFDYISKLRVSKGLKLVPIDGPLLALIRTLKKGGIAGLAADRDITATGQVLDFFGHPAHLPDGHVRLALRTKRPLLVGFSHRNPDQTHTAYFLPPFYLPTAGTEAERLAAGMNFVIGAMEDAIRPHPEQWTLTVSIWAEK
jgi:KDO2-lipid IV(A) lauroyltransferase